MTQDQHKLESCPFCGMRPPNDLIDTLYPTGVRWREDDGMRHYLLRDDKREAHGEVWGMHCTANMGGCGAAIHGDSEEEAVAAWNRRAHLQQRPLPAREGTAEALQSLDAMVPAHLRSSRHGENFMGQHYEKVRAVLLSPVREEPTGWKLVPVEPTEAMVQAALDCQDADPEDGPAAEVYHTYLSMLAASPSVQNTGEGETGMDGVGGTDGR